MLKNSLKVLAAVVALASVSPASAAIYQYNVKIDGTSNTDVLRIDTVAQAATFTGAAINASMTSAAFATFTGGATPNFTAVLSSLDGTRLIKGVWVTDNPLYSTTSHPQKLIMDGAGNVNLWAWWGNPITGGDYTGKITGYGQVPEPGMLGLVGATLAGVALARRRRKAVAA